ncbi:MAG: hypothetical protein EP319_00180 [Deltaproteobacteria bacterium]|nr:MAG: hypothetical protein EP319_00180 [Deltaproteobacteria bacterium]
MENGKPFIFIHPLSDALQKLLDEYKEKASAESLEIFELENVAEVTQVLPTLGQSLTITSSPKKCAQILQTCKNIIKRNNLKIILLSPKQLPWKVQQKLTKIGLTECAVEPIPQRTLSYKVNLHLRAIKTRSEEEAEMNKTFNADGDNQFNDMDKQGVEKGIKRDENELDASDLYGKKDTKSKSIDELKDELNEELIGEAGKIKDPKDNLKDLMKEGLSLDMSDDDEELDAGAIPESAMPKYVDEDPDALMNELKGMREELGGNLEGEANFQEALMKDLEGKGHFKEEAKGGNYEGEGKEADKLKDLAGKSNFKEENQGGNYEGEGKTADQLKDLAGKNNFKEEDQGGNYEGEGKTADQLKDLAGKNNFKESDQGGNYEGEGKTADQLKSLEGKNKSGAEKQAGNLQGKTQDGATAQPDNLAGKNKFQEEKKGNLEGDQKDGADRKAGNLQGKTQEGAAAQPGNLAGKSKEGVERQPGNLGGKTGQAAERKAGNLDGKTGQAAERQAGNLGGKTQQAAERKKDYDGKGQKADQLEGYYGRKKEKNEENSEDTEKDSSSPLSLAKDKEKKKTEGWEEESKKGMSGEGSEADQMDSHWGKKKDKQEAENSHDDVEQDGTLSLDADKKKKETTGWKEDSKNGMNGKGDGFKADQIDGFYGRKKKQDEEEEKAKNPKADSLEEDKYRKKEKGYSFETAEGVKKQAPVMEAADPKKKSGEDESAFESLLAKTGSEIKYAGPKDWGEQTIDYRKLNDEFGGISTDREGANGTGMEIKEGVPVPEKSAAKDGGLETADIPIVEAVPRGLDDLVSVLDLYLGKKSPAIILDQIAETIISKGAEWSLFCKSDGSKLDLSSYAGLDPIKASQKMNENSAAWLKQGLPEWSDPTFQAEEVTFFFPYFDGVTPLGLFVAHFSKKMVEDDSKTIEVIVEGARGIFLDSHVKVVNEQPKKPGVLGKLFGKKAS